MGSAMVQGELWGRAAATWAELMEPQLRPLAEATLRALEPLAGCDLLDAGCGAGLAAHLAKQLGANVTGVDAAPALIDIARTRTPDGNFRVGDIEDLPFEADRFDVVTAFNAIQYATDPVAAVIALARVCRTGGMLAIGVWGDPSRCETEGLFARLRSLAPPAPGTPAPLAVSEAGVVESLLENAGLQCASAGTVDCPFIFANLDEAWTGHQSSGALQKVIDAVGADAVRAAIFDVLEADRKPDGQLRQNNVFRYVTATKS